MPMPDPKLYVLVARNMYRVEPPPADEGVAEHHENTKLWRSIVADAVSKADSDKKIQNNKFGKDVKVLVGDKVPLCVFKHMGHLPDMP